MMIGNMSVIVVSSAVAIRELLDENVLLTSSRPNFHMANLVCEPALPMVILPHSVSRCRAANISD
jgi:hypothetical protein